MTGIDPTSPRCVISFDTSLQGLSCGVMCPEENTSYKIVRPMARGQSEDLIPYIQRVLNFAGKTFQDIDFVITTRGPGAFTGLRIGLAAAKALKTALDCHVYGVCSLDALAHQVRLNMQAEGKNYHRLWIILETKRKDFYVRGFDSDGMAFNDPAVVSGDALVSLVGEDDIIAGDGIARFQKDHPGINVFVLHGYNLADPAALWRAAQISADDLSLDPIYLRGADVSSPKKKGRRLVSE